MTRHLFVALFHKWHVKFQFHTRENMHQCWNIWSKYLYKCNWIQNLFTHTHTCFEVLTCWKNNALQGQVTKKKKRVSKVINLQYGINQNSNKAFLRWSISGYKTILQNGRLKGVTEFEERKWVSQRRRQNKVITNYSACNWGLQSLNDVLCPAIVSLHNYHI